MTISSTTRVAGPFIGNGTATVFPFTFKVFAAADLDVIRLNSSTGVESTLVLNSDYTVTLNGNQNTNPGGSVTLSAGALATGLTLTITSDIANLQPTDLTNQGGFYPEVITDSLDRATIQIQQMAEDVGRSIKAPLSDGSVNMELPATSNRASKYLVFDANGLPSVSSGSGTDTALRADLANSTVALAGSSLVGFRANSASSNARTVLDKLRDVVSVKDFGAVGDGVADDTAAIQATLNEAGNRIVTFPAGNYRINSTINLPTTSITIDLGKATILPYGSSRGFYSSIPTPAATTTWSSGFTRGTTVLGVGSASGMAVGQWLVIQPIQTGATPVRVAAHTSKITNISGTNITIADALVMDYTSLSGAAYVSIVAYSDLNGDVQIHNGFVDNRNSTATPAYPDYGVGVIISGRENVLVQNVEFIGPNTSVYESRTPCLINGPCLNATVDQCRFVDGVHAGQFCGFGLCNKATLTNSTIDASGFGVVFTSCEYAEATSNYLTGKQREEARQALSLSLRGIKSFGCGQLAIQDNYISEYESATKIEYTESFIVSGNYCINCTYSATGASPSNAGITINTGTQNLNKQTSCTITNNAVIDCGGSGIFTTDTIDSIVIDGNVLRNVARYGIYVQGGSNAIITNNSCWDCLQDTNSFYDTRAVITNSATRGLVDGNAVYSVTNTKPAAIGTNVHTVTGIGNWCTTQRLRDIVDPSVNGNIPQAINATISGVVPLTSNTNWLNPTALCGVGALPQQASLLTQSNAVAPTLVAATHSGGSIATSQSLYFDLGGAAFFVVSVNNRSVLCFGDQNYSGITLIASGTPNFFSNTIGTIDRINIYKNASTNQIRIQNGTLSAQSISVCSFGGVPTSSSVV